MSAMRAVELPEVSAAAGPEVPVVQPGAAPALPQDSAVSRAAARWTGPHQAGLGHAGQRQAGPRQAGQRQAGPRQAGPRQAGPRQAGQRQAASTPLRLTRRGRVVVAVAAALLLTALSLVVAGSALATSHAAAARAGEQHLTQVTVRPGQSLWSVAEAADPDADTRLVIQQIINLNGLTGDTIVAGQQLWVPLG
jgi:LysM repeat protein